MKNKKTFLFILLVFVLGMCVAGWYLYIQYYRVNKNLTLVKADFVITASDLLTAFSTNEVAANQKYWDRVLEVSGKLKDINTDGNNSTIIIGDINSMSSVRGTLDSTEKMKLMALQIGMQVTLKGICTGFTSDELLGSDVILVRCIINSKKSFLKY